MKFKVSDNVKTQLWWPHSQLQYQYINKAYSYQELNLSLFVEGDLEIIELLDWNF